MKQKIYTVAILGVGSRGGNAYGRLINEMKDKFRIVALCDLREDRLSLYGEEFGIPTEMRFSCDDEFLKVRRADALLIATYDKDHAWQCERAFKLGYKVLLEKSVGVKRDECLSLLDAQRECGGVGSVCHVLRYSPIYIKVSELLAEGRIGRLVSIEAAEPVAYWHQAHSFVRGNSRRSDVAAPMILSKCCHDLDLICHYAGAECVSVTSVGELTFFTEENAPEDTAARCTECRLVDECPYSAKRIYIDKWKASGSPENSWPTNTVATAPVTEEGLREALRVGQFGRCVFRCDNDAVDHQSVQMEFGNGVKATLNMTAFTSEHGRQYKFHGTYGLITVSDSEIVIAEYGKEAEVIRLEELAEANAAHGGGDKGLIQSLYAMLSGEESPTALERSAEGYLIGFAAEESRLSGGERVMVHGSSTTTKTTKNSTREVP